MPPDHPFALRKAISEQALRQLAGARSYARGRAYFEGGAVGCLVASGGAIEAEVAGNLDYRARLWLANTRLAYSCTCPVGENGEFCKHLVALGLACRNPDAASAPKAEHDRTPTIEDLRADLAARDKDELVSLLMEQAEGSAPLRRRLETEVASRRGGSVRLATFRKAIRDATRARGGFVPYEDAPSFARGIEDVIESIARVLEAGHAQATIEITEDALAAVEKAIEHVDDSGGEMTPLLERLQDIHHAACVKERPDPEALANRLFEWELRTPWNTFDQAVQRYAEVLGEAGLRTYRRRAEAIWSKVPPLKPGDGRDGSRHVDRFRITRIMEGLATLSGDLEALVAVKARDLSMPYAFLKIAEVYREAGQRDEALRWAERGLREFQQERPDSRLQAFLADEYQACGRQEEAMAIAWAMFLGAPGLERYQALKDHADRTQLWASWRERALTHLRAKAEAASVQPNVARLSPRFARREDRSTLVTIFLWEGDAETAWSEAQAGGCTDPLWRELAARREEDHPADVIPVYEQQVERALSEKNNRGYREAVTLLRKIRKLMAALNKQAEFGPYLASVRSAHKAKRNFMALLDRERWP